MGQDKEQAEEMTEPNKMLTTESFMEKYFSIVSPYIATNNLKAEMKADLEKMLVEVADMAYNGCTERKSEQYLKK